MAKKPTSLLKPDDYEWSWADFDDWDVNDHMKGILWDSNKDIPLSPSQKNIVKRNYELIQNKAAWKQKILEFERLLLTEIEPEDRDWKRNTYQIRFDNAKINSNINTEDCIFPCVVAFNQTEFLIEACFRKVGFPYGARFEKTNFTRFVSFENIEVSEILRFYKVNFKQELKITNSIFEDWVSFENSIFYKEVSIESSTLNKGITFYGSQFKDAVNLSFGHLKSVLGLENAVFKSSLNIFAQNLFYLNARDLSVLGNLSIKSVIQKASFHRLNISGSVKLSGCEFKTVPDFRDCKFDKPPEVAGMKVSPPNMHGDILNKDTNEILKRSWFSYFMRHFEKVQDESDVANYRKLKAMALAANDHEKDGEFFAYEMMAKRGHETIGFFPLLLNSLYWLLSFYGQSIARPCWAMIVSFFAFWAGGLVMIRGMTGSLQEIGFAGVHSALNSMPLIGTLFRTTSTPKGHTSWYDETYHQLADKGLSSDLWAAISAGQQIIGAVLFFLLFLGLRNKFRLK